MPYTPYLVPPGTDLSDEQRRELADLPDLFLAYAQLEPLLLANAPKVERIGDYIFYELVLDADGSGCVREVYEHYDDPTERWAKYDWNSPSEGLGKLLDALQTLSAAQATKE